MLRVDQVVVSILKLKPPTPCCGPHNRFLHDKAHFYSLIAAKVVRLLLARLNHKYFASFAYCNLPCLACPKMVRPNFYVVCWKCHDYSSPKMTGILYSLLLIVISTI